MPIDNFSDLYEHTVSDSPILAPFLTGHLAIEYLLRKLVGIYDSKLAGLSSDLNHSRLISLCFDLELITDKQREVLVRINKLRNKFAHQIAFEPTIQELVDLNTLAANAFPDLTDGISQGLESYNECKTIADLKGYEIPELFIQICYDLHGTYQARGGDMEKF